MIQGRAPKRLHDVSHLFLTKSDSGKSKDSAGGEAAVWLVVNGDALNRAHLAAGITSALASEGMRVALCEVGRGLPNVGYYFALEPAEYLALALDASSVISGKSGGSIRFSIALAPGRFSPGDKRVPRGEAPHISLLVFSCPRAGSCREFLAELESAAPKGADGLMLLTDCSNPGHDREVIGFAGRVNPRTVVFVARPEAVTDDAYAADGVVTLPSGIAASQVKRVPPTDPFFSDFTASFLQVISLRRRMERDAVG